MEIIFLGTSSGTPTKQRNVSGIAVKTRSQKQWYLIDCGEGTQHQILHTTLALSQLSAILITHVHGDHCFGLPGLLASAALAGRKEPITIIAPLQIKELIATTQKLTDTFLTFEVIFIDVETTGGDVDLGDLSMSAHGLSHRVPSYAYQFTEKSTERNLDTQKLKQVGIKPGPIWGRLQNGEDVRLPSGELILCKDYLLPGRKPRKIIVGGDNDSPELLKQAVNGADVLVHESTFTEAISVKVGKGPQHSSAKQISEFAAQVGLKNLILTHFSARFQYGTNKESSINEVEDEAKLYYQGNLYLANDFDRFYLDKNGVVSLEEE